MTQGREHNFRDIGGKFTLEQAYGVKKAQAPKASVHAEKQTAAEKKPTHRYIVKKSTPTGKNLPVKISSHKSVAVKPEKAVGEMLDNVKKKKQTPRAIRTVSVKPHGRPFPFGILIGTCICAMMLVFLVFNYAKLNDCSTDLAELKGELEDLNVQRTELEGKLEKSIDLGELEKMASEELGFVKKENLRTKVVCAERDDLIEVMSNPNAQGGLSVMLSALYDGLLGMLE